MSSSPSLSSASSPDARDGGIPYRSAWSHSCIEAVGLLIYLDDRVQLGMLSHTDPPHIDLFGWSWISLWSWARRCRLLGSDGGETAGLS